MGVGTEGLREQRVVVVAVAAAAVAATATVVAAVRGCGCAGATAHATAGTSGAGIVRGVLCGRAAVVVVVLLAFAEATENFFERCWPWEPNFF